MPPTPPDIAGTERRSVTIETTDVGSIDLSVLEGGDGAPTLFLHGWPEHAGCWRQVIPRVTGDLRVIAPDLRGFGWSDTPGAGYDHFTFAADAFALLDALGIEKANVVGHDWGGAAAFEMALSRPERVGRMLVLNTLPPWIELSFTALRHMAGALYVPALAVFGEWAAQHQPARLAHGFRRDTKHTDLFTAADARAYAEVLRQPERARATKLLYRHYLKTAARMGRGGPHDHDRLTTTTRFLFATGDRAVSAELLRGIEKHCDDLTMEYTAAAGHFVCEELPELVSRRALELVKTDA